MKQYEQLLQAAEPRGKLVYLFTVFNLCLRSIKERKKERSYNLEQKRFGFSFLDIQPTYPQWMEQGEVFLACQWECGESGMCCKCPPIEHSSCVQDRSPVKASFPLSWSEGTNPIHVIRKICGKCGDMWANRFGTSQSICTLIECLERSCDLDISFWVWKYLSQSMSVVYCSFLMPFLCFYTA